MPDRPRRENYASGYDGEKEYNLKLEKYCSFLEDQNKQSPIHNFEYQSKQFSLPDMREAFKAGDKYRLYIYKNAVGLGYPYFPEIPSSSVVMEEMCFEKWIESKI